MLVDGREVGLGALLERSADGIESWSLYNAVSRADAMGIQWKLPADTALRQALIRPTPRCPDLSLWRPSAAQYVAGDSLGHTFMTDPMATFKRGQLQHTEALPKREVPAIKATAGGPRLAVACLLYGVAVEALQSWLLWHLTAGFERIDLFFDRPDEPAEQVNMSPPASRNNCIFQFAIALGVTPTIC